MASFEPQMLVPGARLALLANPVARRAGNARRLEEAALALRQRYRVDVVPPGDPAGIASAARAAASSHDAVVVLGGDGTLNHVVNALNGASVPVGLLPLGTGNDFARAMGIPSGMAAAAARVLDGRVRRVDLLEVNGHFFCTAGLIGLPADAALSVDRWTHPSSPVRPIARLLGGATYRLAGLQHLALRGGRTRLLRILNSERCVGAAGAASATANARPAGGEPSVSAHGVFIANTRVLGGGLVLPLQADDSDGCMEVAIIPRMPRLRLWWAFACFAQGWKVPDGVLDVVRTAAVEIHADEDLPFTADGDLLCRDRRFAIRVHPGALRVIC